MSLKINDNIDLPNSITAHNRISLNSVSVSGGGASPELIARVAKLERTVTKQQGAIEEMDRDLDGVHGTLESVDTDITELDTAMTAAEGEIDAIHNKNAAQDVVIASKQDQLTFDATPTEDSGNPVTSDGIFKSLADVIEIAEGKTSSFTLSAQTVGNEAFNSQAGSIEVTLFTDINGNEVTADKLKIGDIILVTELDVPDRWVGTVGETVTLYRMETAKVDLTAYYTKTEADALLSGKVDNTTLDEYYTKLLSDARYFRVIDPPASTTLTDEEVELFKQGAQINGTFAGFEKPTIFPLFDMAFASLDSYCGMMCGNVVNAGGVFKFKQYRLNKTTKVFTTKSDGAGQLSFGLWDGEYVDLGTRVNINQKRWPPSWPAAGMITKLRYANHVMSWADDYDFITLTQADYDAMASHDDNTFYFIPEEE